MTNREKTKDPEGDLTLALSSFLGHRGGGRTQDLTAAEVMLVDDIERTVAAAVAKTLTPLLRQLASGRCGPTA